MSKKRRCGIIAVGNEILQGYVRDSNSFWLARRLNNLGFDVERIFVVGDVINDIVDVLDSALRLGLDLIFVCGGVGGTPDDRTVTAVAQALGLELVRDETVLGEIQKKIELLKKKNFEIELSKWILKMAYIPKGSIPLKNSLGFAPGIMIELQGTKIFVLPGVPVEMKTVFAEEVEPKLGFGERRVMREVKLDSEETKFSGIVERLEKKHEGVTIGMYPHFGKMQVIIRIIGDEREVKNVEREIIEKAKRLGVGFSSVTDDFE